MYSNRWFSQGWSKSWPPRSPDLSPLKFCPLGHLKSMVYSTPIYHVQQRSVENPCINISIKACIFASGNPCCEGFNNAFTHTHTKNRQVRSSYNGQILLKILTETTENCLAECSETISQKSGLI